MGVPLVHGAADITPDWLTAALETATNGAVVEGVEASPIGTGQVATTLHLALTFASGQGPSTLVAKVPSDAEASRVAAAMVRTYEIEAAFFNELAKSLEGRIPTSLHAHHDLESGAYCVLLEEVANAKAGDQMVGLSIEEAAAAIDEMALIHASRWNDASLAELPWLARSSPEGIAGTAGIIEAVQPGFAEAFADRLDAEVLELVGRLGGRHEAIMLDRPGPHTVAHGDFRADNLLLGAGRVAVLDWQTVTLGPGWSDLSYFIGGSLNTATRRTAERELVERYVAGLEAKGVSLGIDEPFTEYRRYAFSGLVMAIAASQLVAKTERGDEMFATMANRHGRQALDHDSESLIRA